MGSSIPSQANFGSFVPTTNIWDIQQLQQLDIDPQLKELLVRLYQNVNTISLSLNTRDAGYYVQEEFINGQIFFPNPALSSSTPQSPTMRQVYRLVIDTGTLPNAATSTIPLPITLGPTYTMTRIYGAATDLNTSFIPLPYASPVAGDDILLRATTTDIIIQTAIDYTAYTTSYVVIEYIKN